MALTDEPSALAFARDNVRRKQDSSPLVVEWLVRRIDTLQRQVDMLTNDDDSA